MGHHLFIVSRQQPDLYSYLTREFSEEPDVHRRVKAVLLFLYFS